MGGTGERVELQTTVRSPPQSTIFSGEHLISTAQTPVPSLRPPLNLQTITRKLPTGLLNSTAAGYPAHLHRSPPFSPVSTSPYRAKSPSIRRRQVYHRREFHHSPATIHVGEITSTARTAIFRNTMFSGVFLTVTSTISVLLRCQLPHTR